MNQSPPLKKTHVAAVVAGILLVGVFFWSTLSTFAFNGPTQNPPSGSGAIGTDASNNVYIGGNLNVTGTITSAGGLGGSTISAGNVSAGEFGSNTGGGGYSFSGDVGIGTTSPQAVLDVNGGSNVALIVRASSADSWLMQVQDNLGNQYIGLGYQGAIGGGYSGYGTIGLMDNNRGPTVYFTGQNGGDSYIDTGNFGIGTSTPAYPLDVNGQVNSTGYCISGANCITSWPSGTLTNSSISATGPITWSGSNVIGLSTPLSATYGGTGTTTPLGSDAFVSTAIPSTYVSTINGTGGTYNIYGGLGVSVTNGTASTTLSINQSAALSFTALTGVSSTGITFTNATSSGNLQVATLHMTGALTASSTLNVQSTATFAAGISQSGAANSLASTTIAGNTTSTSLTLTNAVTTGSSIGGSLTIGACTSTTATITGATTSTGAVFASPQTYPGAGISWRAYVSSANTVTVVECAETSTSATATKYNLVYIQ